MSDAAATRTSTAAASRTPDDLAADSGMLSEAERTRVLSALRVKLGLIGVVLAVVVLLSAIVFFGVTRIFDWLTPSMRYDLEKKAQRGAIELAQTGQLGMLVHDRAALHAAAADYLADNDVRSLLFLDDAGKPLLAHGELSADRLRVLLALPAGRVHSFDDTYAAWATSDIEGVGVGRVVLVVSKARLAAGLQLRREILTIAAIGCIVALGLSLLFVHFYIGPILRVTSEAFVRLSRTTEAALAAARLKSQFLANMSHEIRTPMNGIVGVIDLLNRTALSGKQQRYAQTIESSARSLLTIVDDILDFSKLEAGKYHVRADDFEVQQSVQDVVELLAPRAHGKGIELVSRIDPGVPYSFRGDIERVKQVTTNLVGNAIKFTERGHVLVRVQVASRQADEVTLRIAVEDTGIGISEEGRGQLFGVFSQVDGSLTRKYGGTGLGLAISKRLAEAMGGEIGVETVEGEGSVFWFTVRGRVGALSPGDATRKARDARVLVVSSDCAERDALCERIGSWGMRFAIAERADEAFSQIMEADPEPFSVMVLDAAFEDGAPDCQRLLDLCAAEALPIVRLLWTTQRPSPRAPGEHGAIYLTKPVRASELYNALAASLDGVPFSAARSGDDDEPAQSSQPTGDVAVATVLVVDDNQINRLVAVDVLTELGYRSETACNGAEALECAARGGYAAILMDCQMPELDGYEATRRIRALGGSAAEVPIIALTAHAMVGDRDRVLDAGMNDYTAKPVRVRALERVLARWVRASETPQSSDAAAPPACGRAEPAPAPAMAVESAQLGAPVLDPTIPRAPRIVALFLRVVPELMRELAAAVARKDPKHVRELAHKLKGNCLSLGTTRLADACVAIERAAHDGQIDHDTHQRLPELYEGAKLALEATSQGARSLHPEARP